MRGFLTLTLAALVALGSLAPAMAHAADRTPDTAVKEDGGVSYSLATIMDEPKPFLKREVMFLCRFAAEASLFSNGATRFTRAQHANFAAWADKALLWDAEARKNVLPTLYINKKDRDAAATLARLNRYDLVAVTGRVVDVQSGYPCILVSKIEHIDSPEALLRQAVVELMQQGCEALRIEAGDVAARAFEQALVLGLPGEYRAKTFEQLAQANLLAGRLNLARNCLQQALQMNREDTLLHAALADVALRMSLPQEALDHAAYALEKTGDSAPARGIRAEALAALGKQDEATAAIAEAAGLAGYAPRDQAMLDVRRARVNLLCGRVADAASAYAAAVQPQAPLSNDAWLHREIGLFYEKLALESGNARHLDSAFNAYETAFRLNRSDAEPLYAMMEVEFRRQKLADSPDYATLASLGATAAQATPGYVPARILEGRVLYALGRTGEAEHSYQTIANRVSHDPLALLALAEAYVELGNPDEAVRTVRRARELQPWNDRVQAVGGCLEQGVAMARPVTPGSVRTEPAAYAVPGADGEFPSIDEFFQDVPKVFQGESDLPGRAPEGKAWEYIDPAEIVPHADTVPEAKPSPRENAPAPTRIKAKKQVLVAGLDIGSSALPPASDKYPQEIQASVRPSVAADPQGPRFPVTEVRIPAGTLRQRPEAIAIPPLQGGTMREASVDEDGYLRFGMMRGSTAAYASMPVPEADGEYLAETDEAKIPPAFSFKSDETPLLLAEVVSPGRGERDLPMRNANLYRRWTGSRRPAEIIEREPVSPRVGMDTPAMVPPKDGSTPRAEVRIPQVQLPSSSRGIGAMGEYRHGR